MSRATLKQSLPLISKPFAECDSIMQDLVSQQLFIECLLCVRSYSSIVGTRGRVVKNIEIVSQSRRQETAAFLIKNFLRTPRVFSGDLTSIRAPRYPSDISMYAIIPTVDRISSPFSPKHLDYHCTWTLEPCCLGSSPDPDPF